MKIRTAMLVTALVASSGLVSAASAASFNYTSFPSSSGLTLVNDASVADGRLVLNTATGSSRGAAWHTASKMDVGVGFTTTFDFRIADRQSELYAADGFAFVIQNSSPTAIGADGGGIGYAENPSFGHQPGIPNSLAVEFDVFNNSTGWSDTPHPRSISIQSRGTDSNSPDTAYSMGAASIKEIADGASHQVTIVYTPGIMEVLLDGDLVLSAEVNLGMLQLDSGNAWVGFTASTGGAFAAESHQIESWAFNPVIPAPGAGALAAAGLLLAARRRRA